MSDSAPQPGVKSSIWRWPLRLARIAVLVYLGLAVIFYVIQDRFIFPGADTQGHPDSAMKAAANSELLILRTRDGVKVTALFGKAFSQAGNSSLDTSKCSTVIYFYGNGSCLAGSQDVFDHIRRIGCNIIIPDFLGYGMSDGKPSERGFYATADTVYDYLLTRGDIDKSKIVACGWSLGGAVAIDLASRRPIAALAVFSGFTSMDEMAHRFLPWLPTSLILRHHFDNLKKIPTITCPIFLAHGVVDEMIPPAMSDRLAATAKVKVTRIHVERAGHNDIFEVGGNELFDELDQFLKQIEN